MSKLLPFAPVAVDQTWSYDSSYHRQDRILIVRYLSSSARWETKECQSGDVRNYSEPEIHHLAVPTLLQPKQVWDGASGGRIGSIRLLRCFRTYPNTPWIWEHERVATGQRDVLGEDLIVQWYALLDATAITLPPARPTRQSNGICDRCKGPALIIFQWVECSTKICPNYKP